MKQLMSKSSNKSENIALSDADSASLAMRVSTISVIINLILSALKFIAGIVANSGAMISDAVHSASDVFSTFIVMIGVSVSKKKSDEEHQYGHERLECVASMLLAIVLALVGLGIGYAGLQKITGTGQEALVIPGRLAMIAALVSIVVKEWMYWFTKAAAKKIKSGALMADAWHHRSDALSSIGSFIGIFGARLGLPILDPLASIVICLFIEKAALDIFRDSVNKMIDKSCTQEQIEKMREVVGAQEGVLRIDELKTRLFGSKIYVDVEISAEGNMRLCESHAIAENVHDAMEQAFPDIKHCMVHVNPMME